MKPPAPPPEAVAVFGPSLPTAERYAGWLAEAGVVRGLIGPREVERLWPRHLLNCAALQEPLDAAVPPGTGGTVCDLGSGAGLPGIVLALLRPDLDVVLLEPLQRRADFLTDVVADLALPRTRVLRGRAEDVTGQLEVEVVVARAVAPLDRLAGWAVPLLEPGGQLLALKGARAQAELAAAAELDRLGVGARDILEVTGGGHSTRVVRLVYDGPTDPAPRRQGRGRRPTTSGGGHGAAG